MSEEAKTNKVVLKTPDAKRVLVSEREDECVYGAPQNPPNTGTKYTYGTDLYRHKTRKGNIFYYFLKWSMWQGSEDSYELCTEEEAMEFLEEKLGGSYWVQPGDKERIAELFPDLFKETA